jgi:hypothetical protein
MTAKQQQKMHKGGHSAAFLNSSLDCKKMLFASGFYTA